MPDRQQSDSTLRNNKIKVLATPGIQICTQKVFQPTHGESDYVYGWQVKISTKIAGFGKCGNSDVLKHMNSDTKRVSHCCMQQYHIHFLVTSIYLVVMHGIVDPV